MISAALAKARDLSLAGKATIGLVVIMIVMFSLGSRHESIYESPKACVGSGGEWVSSSNPNGTGWCNTDAADRNIAEAIGIVALIGVVFIGFWGWFCPAAIRWMDPDGKSGGSGGYSGGAGSSDWGGG